MAVESVGSFLWRGCSEGGALDCPSIRLFRADSIGIGFGFKSGRVGNDHPHPRLQLHVLSFGGDHADFVVAAAIACPGRDDPFVAQTATVTSMTSTRRSSWLAGAGRTSSLIRRATIDARCREPESGRPVSLIRLGSGSGAAPTALSLYGEHVRKECHGRIPDWTGALRHYDATHYNCGPPHSALTGDQR